jgi:hypothetical protein
MPEAVRSGDRGFPQVVSAPTDQLSSLAGGNCEMGQGYYFAEPLTRSALDDLPFPLHMPDERE